MEKIMKNKRQHYGFITALTMIVGIVVGSGIFFKADDVLKYTGGSIKLGILVFCIGAFSIIFGSLTLTELSMRTQGSGGAVGYYEEFISPKIACGFGWFQVFAYYPTLIAVISWVAGLYTCLLFNLPSTLEMEIFIGLIYMVGIYGLNILSLRLGGYFQNLSTFIKLIPLLGIALIGMFWGSPHPVLPENVELLSKSDVSLGWLAALAPIAFSYDGWIITTSISNEVKNPKKNMTLALIFGPLIVLGVYLLYFIGLNNILGTEYIMSMGNSAVNTVGELLLGNQGSKMMLIFVIISVLGVVNGVTLGSIRMPKALADKKMIPYGEKIAKVHPKFELSLGSCFTSLGVSMIWLVIHYITQKSGIIRTSDVSEVAIVFGYVLYMMLYIKVLKMKKDKMITSYFKGIICPIFGLLGSLIILVGGIVSNPIYGTIFLLFCGIIFMTGCLYYHRSSLS